jgi:hypothetical protein
MKRSFLTDLGGAASGTPGPVVRGCAFRGGDR